MNVCNLLHVFVIQTTGARSKIRVIFLRFLTLTFGTENWHTGYSCLGEHSDKIYLFSEPFVFEL